MQSENESWVTLGQWDDVAKGLRMFMAYMITLIAFTVIVMLVTIAVAASGKASALSSIATIAKVSGVIALGVAVFGLIAVERYSRVAPETGARSTAKAALFLGIASLVLSAVGIFRLMSVTDLEELGAFNLLEVLTRIVGVVQFFCFLASMRTCAAYIGRMELYEHAGKTMTLLGVTIVLAVLSQVMSAAGSAPLVLLLGLGTLGIGIWCVVYIMMLLSRLAKAVSRDAHLPATFS